MAEWDLYLDESGAFEYAGKHTLIGGFLLPHSKHGGMKMFQTWNQEIHSRIEEAGKTAEGYIFDHCSENKNLPERWTIQRWVLGQFMQKLAEVGAYPVIFDNPEGQYHIDSNSTFMTIFANGITRLYGMLKRQHPKEQIYLYIHAASRKNITKTHQAELYDVSPVGGTENILSLELYINQIRNMVFLNGGHALLEVKAFEESLRRFEIVKDLKVSRDGHDVWVPHPATVVCDYICNSMYSSSTHHDLRAVLDQAGMKCIDVFDGPLADADYSDDVAAQRHDWGRQLKNLVSLSFPKEKTSLFFERMALDRAYDPMNCVHSLVDYLRSFVLNRENMQDWIERIQLTIEKTSPLRHDAYLVLKAHLLLYLIALDTHLGRNDLVKQVSEDFIRCSVQIDEADRRDELIELFCNRQIVSYTDLFQFEEAEHYYHLLAKAF